LKLYDIDLPSTSASSIYVIPEALQSTSAFMGSNPSLRRVLAIPDLEIETGGTFQLNRQLNIRQRFTTQNEMLFEPVVAVVVYQLRVVLT
jgi:hypothetical protein